MLSEILFIAVTLSSGVVATTYPVPASPPSGASPQIDPAPVAVSIEFFTFPAYITNVSATAKCLSNLKDAQGTWAPLRIGGLTQDRATWDPSASSAVKYTVASPTDAPSGLTFGPKFISLATAYEGETTLGLNRRLNILDNTVAAAKAAYKTMKNLYAFELGNEPEAFSSGPIATNGWSPDIDAASEVRYQTAVGQALDATNIVQAGVFGSVGNWGIAKLAPKEGSAIKYVKSFSDHGYPQSACNGAKTNLSTLMDHATTVSYTRNRYTKEVAAAAAVGKVLEIGETNSADCGRGGISPTFGAGLWLVDYVFQGLIVGAKRLYFHQGTIGNCAYCWWTKSTIASPFYGAYFVAEAFGGSDRVAMLDTGKTPYAVYAIYKNSKPIRILLYNSDYYVSGKRSSQTYTL